MPEVIVQVQNAKVYRRFDRARGAAARELRAALHEITSGFVETFIRDRMSGRRGRGRGLGVNARSGWLRSQLKTDVAVPLNNIQGARGRVGFFTQRAAKIARVHEYGTRGAGGTLPDIKPRNAQWLTVPLPAAQDARGVTRAPARAYTNAFVIKSKKGNLLIVEKRTSGLVPLFVLKKRVAIPPRLELRKRWRMPSQVNRRASILKKHLMAALKSNAKRT